MKNNLFKKVSAVLTSAGCMFCVPGFFISTYAYSNVVTSPISSIKLNQKLMKDDSNIGNVCSDIVLSDNKFDITFNASEYYANNTSGLDELNSDEVYFAVFMDHKTGKNLAMLPLNKGEKVGNTGYYKYFVSYEAPFYVDMVDVHIYHQQASLLPSCYPEASKFVGKLRLFTASNTIYLREGNNNGTINIYGRTGDDVSTTEFTDRKLYARLTQDLFSFYCVFKNPPADEFYNLINLNCICVIEPIVGGGNMKWEDRVFPLTGYKGYYGNPEPVPVGGSLVLPNDNVLDYQYIGNFKLPEDLTEFSMKICQGSAFGALLYQGHVTLQRN